MLAAPPVLRRDVAQRKSSMQLQIATETHQHDALPVLRQEMAPSITFGSSGPVCRVSYFIPAHPASA